MKDEQLIFFIGAPGSSWSRIASILKHSPKLNLNLSDHSPEREYYIKTSKSWSHLINHQGSYFGTGMEFGHKFEKPQDYYNKISFKHELAKAFNEHDDNRNYLIKSHSLAYNIDWLVETFPTSKIILVVKQPIEECVEWWLRAGGFDITYPSYRWYKDKDLKKEFNKQQYKIKKFINDCGYPLYAPTNSFFKNKLEVDIEHEYVQQYIRAIQLLSPTGNGDPDFRTQMCFYNMEI
jgi:hypothetical protein